MDSTAIPTPITQITPITPATPITQVTPIIPIFKKINEIYVKSSYLERYGGSVIFTIFAILIVFFYFVYLNIQNNKEIVKKDWANNKCSPQYLPFAGMIMEPKDMSNMEYTIKNFSECSEVILKDIIQVALAPLEAASILISASVHILTGVTTNIMGAISGFRRNAIQNQTKNTSEKQVAFSSILAKLVNLIKDTMNKGEGILTVIFFVFFSAYKAAASVFYVILFGEAIILLIMFAVMAIAWGVYIFLMVVIFTIPIAGLYLWVPVGLTIIYVAFMIMILVLVIFTASVIAKTK
jgi:hypothetical protein